MMFRKRETIEKMILSYLEQNPDAADTVDGITRFWMQQESAKITFTKVSDTLAKLLKKGFIQTFQSADGTLYYKLNKDQAVTKRMENYKMKQKVTRKKIFRITFVLVVVVLVVAVSVKFVEALCIQPQEEGSWVNTDPNTRSFTRIQLRFICQDQILNGQPYPPGPPWYVHIWGKCHPSDCDWGEVGASELGTGHIYAFYNQGFAKRYVYAKMSQYRPGQLWVWTWTDFTDPNRPDYGVHNWFRRL